MAVDTKFLRQHYASLSDEGLLAIDRADLVEAAQKCYDEEVGRRDLGSPRRMRRADPPDELAELPDEAELELEEDEEDAEPAGHGEKPAWLEEGSEVYGRLDLPGSGPGADLTNARDVLEAAGIPCYLEASELPEEPSAPRGARLQWRVLVPGKLNLRATGVLERDLFNAEFEEQWKAHLETMSDADVRAMNPETVFCGLFDRIERVTRAYDEEVARRRLGRTAG